MKFQKLPGIFYSSSLWLSNFLVYSIVIYKSKIYQKRPNINLVSIQWISTRQPIPPLSSSSSNRWTGACQAASSLTQTSPALHRTDRQASWFRAVRHFLSLSKVPIQNPPHKARIFQRMMLQIWRNLSQTRVRTKQETIKKSKAIATERRRPRWKKARARVLVPSASRQN